MDLMFVDLAFSGFGLLTAAFDFTVYVDCGPTCDEQSHMLRHQFCSGRYTLSTVCNSSYSLYTAISEWRYQHISGTDRCSKKSTLYGLKKFTFTIPNYLLVFHNRPHIIKFMTLHHLLSQFQSIGRSQRFIQVSFQDHKYLCNPRLFAPSFIQFYHWNA